MNTKRSILFAVVISALIMGLCSTSTAVADDQHYNKKTVAAGKQIARSILGTTEKVLVAAQPEYGIQVPKALPKNHLRQIGKTNSYILTGVGQDGIPDGWCNNHPAVCTAIHANTNAALAKYVLWGDKFHYDTGPVGWRGIVNNLLTVNPKSTQKDNGGYGDWAGPADCTLHGYECYGTANTRHELSQAEVVILSCGATVVVSRMPPAASGPLKEVVGNSAKACFFGIAGYFGWLWN